MSIVNLKLDEGEFYLEMMDRATTSSPQETFCYGRWSRSTQDAVSGKIPDGLETKTNWRLLIGFQNYKYNEPYRYTAVLFGVVG